MSPTRAASRNGHVRGEDIERVPPHDFDAEIGALGGLAVDPTVAYSLMPRLHPDDFHSPECREIAKAACAIHERRGVVDALTLRSELRRRSVGAGVLECLDVAVSIYTERSDGKPPPQPGNGATYLAIVERTARARRARIAMLDAVREIDRGVRDPDDVLAAVRLSLTTEAAGTGLGKAEPVIVNLGTVRSEPTAWLWRPYLPLGKITLIEGDPGASKSFLTLKIAAHVTTGAPFPGESASRPAANVVLLSAEDGLADTIRPRLDTVGADPARVLAFTGLQATSGDADPQRQVTMQDVESLDDVLGKYRPALVVVDPVQAYLGAGVDAHRANETRPVLAACARLAEAHGCAIVLVRHLAKARAGRAMYAGLGSIDFAAAARSVLLVGEDARAPTPGRRVVLQVKSSLAPTGPGVAYDLSEAGGFRWAGASDLTPADLLRDDADPEDRDARGEARDFLLDFLRHGPRSAIDVLREGKAQGVPEKTCRRAFRDLGGKPRKGGMTGGWVWALPNTAGGAEDGHLP